MNVKNLFSNEEKEIVVNSIKKAELNSSAEIKVHIESKCKEDVLDRATAVFDNLKMRETKDRNGVLIYVAINSRKCAIIGDEGINRVVTEDFWNRCYAILQEFFKKEEYAQGLAKVISMCGQYFSTHFKYTSDDVNEISDDISFGK